MASSQKFYRANSIYHVEGKGVKGVGLRLWILNWKHFPVALTKQHCPVTTGKSFSTELIERALTSHYSLRMSVLIKKIHT